VSVQIIRKMPSHVNNTISKSTQCNPDTSFRVPGKAQNYRAGQPDSIRNSYILWTSRILKCDIPRCLPSIGKAWRPYA